MSELKYEYKVVIGDWSKDGHNQSDFVQFKCSHEQADIKKAYLAFVKKYKISLDNQNRGKNIIEILSEYEDDTIDSEDVKTLEAAGVDFNQIEGDEVGESGFRPTSGGVACLFLEMVKTQLPGFVYKTTTDEVKCINGFWSKDFNYGFGYGIYH